MGCTFNLRKDILEHLELCLGDHGAANGGDGSVDEIFCLLDSSLLPIAPYPNCQVSMRVYEEHLMVFSFKIISCHHIQLKFDCNQVRAEED